MKFGGIIQQIRIFAARIGKLTKRLLQGVILGAAGLEKQIRDHSAAFKLVRQQRTAKENKPEAANPSFDPASFDPALLPAVPEKTQGILARYVEDAQTALKKLEEAPTVTHTISRIDASVAFMTNWRYQPDNTALGSSRGPIALGLWVALAFGIITLIWGFLAPLDSAAVARGSVVLLSSRKTIQHLEGGIITAILVKEGDTVRQGQPLVRLNDTTAKARLEILNGQYYVAKAAEGRLIAERDGLDQVTFDPKFTELSASNPEILKVMDAQVRIFESRRDAQQAKIDVLNQRIAQAREEILGTESQIKAAGGQIALIEEEIGTVKKLLEKGSATRPRLLALQRQATELQGQKGLHQALVAKAKQNITETEIQIINLENEYMSKVAEELKDTQASVVDLEEKLRASQDVLDRMIVTAPASGIITGLKYHTIGGVISPGTAIMDIVPQDDLLIIEAKIQPTDIDVVHTGLSAKVLLTAYKSRRMPTVKGKVTQVSADKFTEQAGMQSLSYYTAKVEIDKDELKKLEDKVELYPGMPVDVLIRTGSRSFVGYLFAPITDSMHRAFREE